MIDIGSGNGLWWQALYLKQCWIVGKWTPRNKLQGHFNKIMKLTPQGNAFENIWKMSAISPGSGMLTLHCVQHIMTKVNLRSDLEVLKDITHLAFFNTLRTRQNGRHFTDDIFNAFSWMKMYDFRLRFHWSLFLRVQLTISQHWFR